MINKIFDENSKNYFFKIVSEKDNCENFLHYFVSHISNMKIYESINDFESFYVDKFYTDIILILNNLFISQTQVREYFIQYILNG